MSGRGTAASRAVPAACSPTASSRRGCSPGRAGCLSPNLLRLACRAGAVVSWRDVADESVTQLLAAAREGDRAALERAFAAVYGELHRLARRQRARSRPGDTLSTTVLVHEAFLKLSQGAPVAIQDRQHFFALA
ncbi:MAG: hypothetical protein KBF21_15335, partial [Thermoanaerobaculia bacterium]|nr:hypothetical protein [Thermoanaerobaculia bacterium]